MNAFFRGLRNNLFNKKNGKIITLSVAGCAVVAGVVCTSVKVYNSKNTIDAGKIKNQTAQNKTSDNVKSSNEQKNINEKLSSKNIETNNIHSKENNSEASKNDKPHIKKLSNVASSNSNNSKEEKKSQNDNINHSEYSYEFTPNEYAWTGTTIYEDADENPLPKIKVPNLPTLVQELNNNLAVKPYMLYKDKPLINTLSNYYWFTVAINEKLFDIQDGIMKFPKRTISPDEAIKEVDKLEKLQKSIEGSNGLVYYELYAEGKPSKAFSDTVELIYENTSMIYNFKEKLNDYIACINECAPETERRLYDSIVNGRELNKDNPNYKQYKDAEKIIGTTNNKIPDALRKEQLKIKDYYNKKINELIK